MDNFFKEEGDLKVNGIFVVIEGSIIILGERSGGNPVLLEIFGLHLSRTHITKILYISPLLKIEFIF